MAKDRFGSLAMHAYEVMYQWICDGTLPPGTRLSVRDMAAKLETSTGPVRDALIELRSQRLIKGGHGPGWAVADVTPELIDEAMMVRMALEAQAARMCAINATPRDIHKLRMLAAEVDRRMRQGKVEDGLTSELDERFHATVAEIAGSQMLCEEIKRWTVVMNWARIYLRGIPRRSQPHMKIVDAIASGDPRQAEDEMRDHIAHPWQEKKSQARRHALASE